jgi:hypothetical protein
MKNFAVISGNSVVNVIVANDLKSAELASKSNCIEYLDYVGIGWSWDGTEFHAPEVIDEVTPE